MPMCLCNGRPRLVMGVVTLHLKPQSVQRDECAGTHASLQWKTQPSDGRGHIASADTDSEERWVLGSMHLCNSVHSLVNGAVHIQDGSSSLS